jgi:hypothetical protein
VTRNCLVGVCATIVVIVAAVIALVLRGDDRLTASQTAQALQRRWPDVRGIKCAAPRSEEVGSWRWDYECLLGSASATVLVDVDAHRIVAVEAVV